VVSRGRRNTRTTPQVQEFQAVRTSGEHKGKEMAFCLDKSEHTRIKIGSLKPIVRSSAVTGVASTG